MDAGNRKCVVLGVTGGIAAYKSVVLVRLLVREGIDVKVIMTDSAQRFVDPLTFRTLSGNRVGVTLWSDPDSEIPHISLGEAGDILVVAPATANIIGKYANGIADDLLSTTLMAADCPVMLAPAMNTRMYLSPALQANLAQLKDRGVLFVEPVSGELACGDEGKGRMAEPEEIFEMVLLALEAGDTAKGGPLRGKRIIVTAGPTREYIDPVRFISNPSTGRMGYTIAAIAGSRGADVTLISGPVALDPPPGVKFIGVETADEMSAAVQALVPESDALIMSAAVADFKSREIADRKIKKENGVPAIDLVPAEDILKTVSGMRGDCLVIGFAAETNDVIDNGILKLKAKRMDIVVANQVDLPGSGFGTETDLAAIIDDPDDPPALAMMTKSELAERLLDRITDHPGFSRSSP